MSGFVFLDTWALVEYTKPYVETDPAFPMKREGSDLGDFQQISLLPYCTLFTADTTMCRMLMRLLKDLTVSCRVLRRAEFEALLRSGKMP